MASNQHPRTALQVLAISAALLCAFILGMAFQRDGCDVCKHGMPRQGMMAWRWSEAYQEWEWYFPPQETTAPIDEPTAPIGGISEQ